MTPEQQGACLRVHKVSKVPRVTPELLEPKVPRATTRVRVRLHWSVSNKALRVILEQQELRVHKVSKVPRVTPELLEPKVHRVSQGPKVRPGAQGPEMHTG